MAGDETQPEWAKRMECKLDAILEVLTAEDEEGHEAEDDLGPALDMAGRPITNN